MKKMYTYSIKDFKWVKVDNTFSAPAVSLFPMFDKVAEFEPFPGDREKFRIHNPRTGNWREFVFKKESKETYEYIDGDGDITTWEHTIWEFESEDKMKCLIYV